MENKQNYIQWIRSKVGHEKIMLIFAGGCIFNEKGEVLLQRRGDTNKWGFPGGAIELGETPEMAGWQTGFGWRAAADTWKRMS